MVGERGRCSEAGIERDCGAPASENADTSSDKPDENSGRLKSKVSWARFVLPGSVGS